jgi:hypothetical protein
MSPNIILKFYQNNFVFLLHLGNFVKILFFKSIAGPTQTQTTFFSLIFF